MAQERKVYDFASVGNLPNVSKAVENPGGDHGPIGIATPMRLSSKAGTLFEMHTDISKQIRDNFRNMISTNKGERLMLGDFGANLKPLAYELGTDSGDAAAISAIATVTSKYMPYVSLQTFESLKEESTDGSLARIGVRVTFTVPSLGVGPQTVEAIILSAG